MELPKGPFLKRVFTLACLVMALSYLPYSMAAEEKHEKCYECTEYVANLPNRDGVSCIQSGVPYERRPKKKDLKPIECRDPHKKNDGCLKVLYINKGELKHMVRSCGNANETQMKNCVLTSDTAKKHFKHKDGCIMGSYAMIRYLVEFCGIYSEHPPTPSPPPPGTTTPPTTTLAPYDDYVKYCYCHDSKGKACNGGNSLKWTAFGTGLMMAIGITAAALLSA